MKKKMKKVLVFMLILFLGNNVTKVEAGNDGIRSNNRNLFKKLDKEYGWETGTARASFGPPSEEDSLRNLTEIQKKNFKEVRFICSGKMVHEAQNLLYLTELGRWVEQ